MGLSKEGLSWKISSRFIYKDGLIRNGSQGRDTVTENCSFESTDKTRGLCVQLWGWEGVHDRIRRTVGHIPRSDEVGEVLHDFQGQALLLCRELALVGRIEGQSKSILHVCQQFQAEETGKERQEA